jgi:hypothetical protein
MAARASFVCQFPGLISVEYWLRNSGFNTFPTALLGSCEMKSMTLVLLTLPRGSLHGPISSSSLARLPGVNPSLSRNRSSRCPAAYGAKRPFTKTPTSVKCPNAEGDPFT